MRWTNCTLGDVMTLKRGHDLPRQSRHDGEVPVVSSSGVTGYHNESKEDAPGVVTGRYGTLGEVYFIRRAFWPLNTALYVTDFKGHAPQFVSYFLKNAIRDYRSDKAAVPGVDRNVLHRLNVRLPDRSCQERIVDILSAYDDLIENNRRRIALLEQAAQELYREWFVRLRFPGHGSTRIVDGLPEGWERKKIADVCLTTGGGTPSTKKAEYWDGDITWVVQTEPSFNEGLSLTVDRALRYLDLPPGLPEQIKACDSVLQIALPGAARRRRVPHLPRLARHAQLASAAGQGRHPLRHLRRPGRGVRRWPR